MLSVHPWGWFRFIVGSHSTATVHGQTHIGPNCVLGQPPLSLEFYWKQGAGVHMYHTVYRKP